MGAAGESTKETLGLAWTYGFSSQELGVCPGLQPWCRVAAKMNWSTEWLIGNGQVTAWEYLCNWQSPVNNSHYPRRLSYLPSSLIEWTFKMFNLVFSPYDHGIFSPSHSLGGGNWISIFPFSKAFIKCLEATRSFPGKNERAVATTNSLFPFCLLRPSDTLWIWKRVLVVMMQEVTNNAHTH